MLPYSESYVPLKDIEHLDLITKRSLVIETSRGWFVLLITSIFFKGV